MVTYTAADLPTPLATWRLHAILGISIVKGCLYRGTNSQCQKRWYLIPGTDSHPLTKGTLLHSQNFLAPPKRTQHRNKSLEKISDERIYDTLRKFPRLIMISSSNLGCSGWEGILSVLHKCFISSLPSFRDSRLTQKETWDIQVEKLSEEDLTNKVEQIHGLCDPLPILYCLK